MKNTLVIVGTQWGDEGKGKITDFLAQRADVVVRYQGGNNAGHTINFDGKKFALQSIPSGIFTPHIVNIIANGVVFNPVQALEELNGLRARGVVDYQLYISDRAQVIMPYHMDLDGASEALKGDKKIGTTKKGIGPCYADKAERIGIRVGDLLNKEYFKERLTDALEVKNKELEMYGLKTYKFEDLYDKYLELGQIFKDHITDTSVLLNNLLEQGKKVLFEGAQGIMLCLDHGTYPYVTSSSPTAASVPLNTGIAPKYVDNVLGIAKAYSTRVGEGPFPTELFGELADQIRERGHEYGTVTHRPRRVGWLDAVVLKNAKRVSGVDNFSLMLFDVLTGIPKIKICKAYELDGKVIDYIPAVLDDFKRCKPIYEEVDGWTEDITSVKSFDELPINAQKYIKKIEEITGREIAIFSVGPDRTQTIELKKIF